MHGEVVKPAIVLLDNAEFAGASSEVFQAHEHHLHGRNKEAIVEAAKAFESVLKTICDLSGWQYQKGDKTTKLIDIIMSNGLIDGSLQSLLTGVRTTLSDGLPTIREHESSARSGKST